MFVKGKNGQIIKSMIHILPEQSLGPNIDPLVLTNLTLLKDDFGSFFRKQFFDLVL